MIYFTSDLHFGHQKDFLYIPRGFSSIYEHDIAVIQNWNGRIAADDDVYVLGDLLLNDMEYGLSCLRRLNGKIHIILGNHDTVAKVQEYENLPNVVEILGYTAILKYHKYHFYLSHYPTRTSNFDNNKPLKTCLINLCGHSHTQDMFADSNLGLCYHVELDAHNNTPVSIDEIIEDLKNFYR